jgi:predicted aminopeptidase
MRERCTGRAWSGAVAVACTLAVSGCQSEYYLRQATHGQLDIQTRRVPLDEAANDATLHQRTRELLARVPAIKRFGERHGLRPTDNYTEFSNMRRPHLLWVVSASEPYAFKPVTWSFPIVGNFTYVGYFNRADAEQVARQLRHSRKKTLLDVDVRPSDAYSTIGFFRDPVLSTMLSYGDEGVGDLADVVSHESTHATFYVQGQSFLNEGVAEFVGEELASRYLHETFGPDSLKTLRYEGQKLEAKSRHRAMKAAYDALDALYKRRPKPSLQAMEREKQTIFAELQVRLQTRRIMSNATLVQFRTYHGSKETLRERLKLCGGDVRKFLAELERHRPEFERAEKQASVEQLLEPLPWECARPSETGGAVSSEPVTR